MFASAPEQAHPVSNQRLLARSPLILTAWGLVDKVSNAPFASDGMGKAGCDWRKAGVKGLMTGRF